VAAKSGKMREAIEAVPKRAVRKASLHRMSGTVLEEEGEGREKADRGEVAKGVMMPGIGGKERDG